MNVLSWLEQHHASENPVEKVSKIACAEDGKSFIYLAIPFNGLFCWANDVYCKEIPTDYDGSFRGMSLNFCMDGGCEVSLFNGNYVYVRRGILSIDISATKTSHHYPSSRYRGLEIIFDFDAFNSEGLSSIGFNPEEFLDSLANRSSHGSFLTVPGEGWQRKATDLTEHLIAQDVSIEDIRFFLMELLFLISKESPILKSAEIGFVSKGQRKIASETEKIITQDLSHHFSVEELAKGFRISPSSLKKYFFQVYGMPFSVYIHQLRMEKAACLIAEGELSIGEIAEKVGYKNQSKFGTAFKKFFGKPPLEYKRLYAVFQGIKN